MYLFMWSPRGFWQRPWLTILRIMTAMFWGNTFWQNSDSTNGRNTCFREGISDGGINKWSGILMAYSFSVRKPLVCLQGALGLHIDRCTSLACCCYWLLRLWLHHHASCNFLIISHLTSIRLALNFSHIHESWKGIFYIVCLFLSGFHQCSCFHGNGQNRA